MPKQFRFHLHLQVKSSFCFLVEFILFSNGVTENSLFDNFRCELFTGKPQIQSENGYYVSTTLGLTLRLLEKYGWEYLKGQMLIILSKNNLFLNLIFLQVVCYVRTTFILPLLCSRSWTSRISSLLELYVLIARDINGNMIFGNRIGDYLGQSSGGG